MTAPNVLVVHADAGVISAVKGALAPDGLRVRAASDGLRGLAEVDREPPSVVIVDMVLPRLDGLTLIQAIAGREETRDTPAAILSGRASPDAMLMGYAAGARYYISVPFLAQDLRAKIRRLLGS